MNRLKLIMSRPSTFLVVAVSLLGVVVVVVVEALPIMTMPLSSSSSSSSSLLLSPTLSLRHLAHDRHASSSSSSSSLTRLHLHPRQSPSSPWPTESSARPAATPNNSCRSSSSSSSSSKDHPDNQQNPSCHCRRRALVTRTTTAAVVAAAAAAAAMTGSPHVASAAAAAAAVPTTTIDSSSSSASSSSTLNSSILTVSSILEALRAVPTFCIVDQDGAAYMLYKPDQGFAKGYAFLTYDGATVVLQDALDTAQQGGYADTWATATITTIPAPVALRLTLQPRPRTSQKDQSASTILFLIPGAEPRQAALELDKSQTFRDQGKVPLFYFENFRTTDGNKLPLYLNARNLVADWQKAQQQQQQQQSSLNAAATTSNVPPRIQVVDLVTLFGAVVRGRQDLVPTILQTTPIIIVPDPVDVRKAQELLRSNNSGLVPYKLDRMIV